MGMPLQHYSEEFRQRAAELYESTPGASLRVIAQDLGVSISSLSKWVTKYGKGTTASAITVPKAGNNESVAQKTARLEAEIAHLRAENKKLVTEKEILRAAAKYFVMFKRRVDGVIVLTNLLEYN
jgi:transposase